MSAETVKFIYVFWRPEHIPLMRKMKIGIFEGQIKTCFRPFHVDIEAAHASELTDTAVMTLLSDVTNTVDRSGTKAATQGFYRGGTTVGAAAG